MATQSAPLAETALIRVWDLPLRLFHWLLVIAIALAFLSAEEDSALNRWHIVSGWIAGLLIVFRIAWGFVGGEHSRFAEFMRPSQLGHHIGELARLRPSPTVGHNALGALSVLLLLAMVATVVGTGVVLAEEVHELLGWTLLALVGIHVLAVIVMSLLTRENLVQAMVTGRKRAARHPGAGDARRPGLVGTIAALLVLGGAVFAVQAYDPLAFTLRSAEDYEHGAERGGAHTGDEDRGGQGERGGRDD